MQCKLLKHYASRQVTPSIPSKHLGAVSTKQICLEYLSFVMIFILDLKMKLRMMSTTMLIYME